MMKKNIVGRLNDGLVSLMTSLGEKIGAVRYSSSKPDVPDKELLAMYKKIVGGEEIHQQNIR